MPVSASQRQHLARRASDRCEYCLLHADHSIKKHEPDHIIPRKHGGTDDSINLAWACFQCNRYKGSEVAAFDLETGELTPLFNPRQHRWSEHFVLEGGLITPQTAVGRVTVLVLQLNRANRIEVRRRLRAAGLYP